MGTESVTAQPFPPVTCWSVAFILAELVIGAVGLPVRECGSHFLCGRLENQNSAKISAKPCQQHRRVSVTSVFCVVSVVGSVSLHMEQG